MRLCKDSTTPLCQGWPGGMNAWSVSCEGVGSFVYEVQSSITKESAQQ